MLQLRNLPSVLWCALAMLASLSAVAAATTSTDGRVPVGAADESPLGDVTGGERIAVLGSADRPSATEQRQWEEESSPDGLFNNPVYDEWTSQWLPSGLIYHQYMAGARQPRMSLVSFWELNASRTLWDATLGGQVGLWRYGNCDPQHPQGYQLDLYGAAIARLDVENQQDLDSTDYVFGLPLTYGVDNWQFKFGYAHLSSHLGDEFAIRVPGTLDDRINYVRDSLVFGTLYFPHPAWRMYGEAGWAFHRSGGADPFEIQFGTELSQPGPTGRHLTPFLALNANLRQEHNFGGELTAQFGWLRRGETGQTLRFGGHYSSGKSSQMQFLNDSEQQIGLGLWYDF